MAKYQDELLDHEYDGIRELDNDMPPWWLYLFYITIGWAVLYYAFYHVINIGYSSLDEYRQEVDPGWTRDQDPSYQPISGFSFYHSPLHSSRGDVTPWSRLNASPQEQVVEETPATMAALDLLTDPENLSAGKAIFTSKCASCHATDGGGGIGPNLTDDYWLHGAGINNVVKTITFGVPLKGMISWRGFLKKDEIHQVGSFIISLHGARPANPKEPQGEKVTE